MGDKIYSVFLIVFALILLVCALVWFAIYVNKFSSELKYLNAEIERSDDDKREYWIKRRRRLWLSIIPFIKY